LLDSDARGAIKTIAGYGKLKEPVLFGISAYRGLGGVNDGVWVMPFFAGMGQDIFRAPTVFNYFVPDNTISNGKLGPEFEILTSSTAFARLNLIWSITSSGVSVNVPGTGSTFNGTFTPVTDVANTTGTSINWASWQALASNPAALVDKLSWVFAAGAMSQTAQQQIVTAISTIPATDSFNRARLAVYLTLTANQYQVDR
jgi:hypothetical protein